MMNIDSYFEFSENEVDNWNKEKLLSLSELIKNKIPGIKFDWEPGDEEWASFFINRKTVLIVCARLPLAIVQSEYSATLSNLFQQFDIKSLAFENFEENTFSINKLVLEDVFSKKLTNNISYESISINDLWYSTIT